ncbi:PilZ domain-containing protein [Pelagerythrobacter marensis]|uniref:PilZ domain-containing protein n=1 Tax=Pelagerythrobacter marensis TaxID=543877 RepID=A0A0G3X9Y8_9SPHN|nr:PilZ domain-containing protein [Pelagerythrobacter marensis]AKM07163.1 hypothetical protein AM2010_1088 [Pelagerythrobacter marensis]
MSDKDGEIRREERHGVTVPGRYRAGTGVPKDVRVIDISEHGCRFFDKFGTLAKGAQITIRIGSIGPILATVRWSEAQTVGVEFENPIYGPVLDHIRNQLAQGS